MEKEQKRMMIAVNDFVEQMEKKYFRGVQKTMFECSARCVSDNYSERENVEHCIDTCGNNLQRIQNYLKNELQTLQDQLSRCAMTAYDKAIQKHGKPKSHEDVKKVEKALNEQMPTCVDDHIALLPEIEKRFISDAYNNLQ
uniref:Protein FAM136A (inferred by orthology to a human protein) n=1 Tax=Strongyloides venezuelensis TaxID=75913 RepID=A0A0K0G198_STRVS